MSDQAHITRGVPAPTWHRPAARCASCGAVKLYWLHARVAQGVACGAVHHVEVPEPMPAESATATQSQRKEASRANVRARRRVRD